MTANETTGKRDMALSRRHRLWGFDCPCTDVDLLMIEYDTSTPIALIDYKDKNSSENWQVSPNTKALEVLADRAAIPFLVVRYCSQTWWFRVYPISSLAKPLFESGQPFRESEFVAMLYKLRGRTTPDDVKAALEVSPALRAGFVGYDEEGRFLHYCGCGEWGSTSVGAFISKGILGKWYCAQCLPSPMSNSH